MRCTNCTMLTSDFMRGRVRMRVFVRVHQSDKKMPAQLLLPHFLSPLFFLLFYLLDSLRWKKTVWSWKKLFPCQIDYNESIFTRLLRAISHLSKWERRERQNTQKQKEGRPMFWWFVNCDFFFMLSIWFNGYRPSTGVVRFWKAFSHICWKLKIWNQSDLKSIAGRF